MSVPIIPTKEEQEAIEARREFEALLATTPLTEEQIYEAEEAVLTTLNLVNAIPKGVLNEYSKFIESEEFLILRLRDLGANQERVLATENIEKLRDGVAQLILFKSNIDKVLGVPNDSSEPSDDG